MVCTFDHSCISLLVIWYMCMKPVHFVLQAQVKAHQALSVNVKTTSGYTPLHMAVLHGHDDMVHLFLQHGANVNSQNHKNLTPLHISACLRKLLVMTDCFFSVELGVCIELKYNCAE